MEASQMQRCREAMTLTSSWWFQLSSLRSCDVREVTFCPLLYARVSLKILCIPRVALKILLYGRAQIPCIWGGRYESSKKYEKNSYKILAHYCTNMNEFRSISNGSSYNVSLFYAHARINLWPPSKKLTRRQEKWTQCHGKYFWHVFCMNAHNKFLNASFHTKWTPFLRITNQVFQKIISQFKYSWKTQA